MKAIKVQASAKSMTALMMDCAVVQGSKTSKEPAPVVFRPATQKELAELVQRYQQRRPY